MRASRENLSFFTPEQDLKRPKAQFFVETQADQDLLPNHRDYMLLWFNIVMQYSRRNL